MTGLADAGGAVGESRVVDPGSPAAAAHPADVPARADGLVLIGEVPGSGYRRPPSLVRRVDGQTIQLTPLLYAVLDAVDGRTPAAGIAARLTASTRRSVSAENVETLVGRLRELGLLRRADGTEPELKRADPLLGLRFRYAVTDEATTRRLTTPFAVLFAPVVVTLVTLAFLAVCAWVLLEKGLASATHDAFRDPGLLLAVFGVTVLSAGFHEFGHAAAARYGGAQPGAMGAGVYLVWPAFYTDVTDSYRLGRAGRVRTDLGGLYFNAIVALATFGVWFATGWDAVLLVIATQVLQMLRQLAPLVRFDGYHVLADLTGVPDLYHRIGPTLASLLPWRRRSADAADLKPWARAVVTLWVAVVVPVLLGTVLLLVLSLPRVLGTAASGLAEQWSLLSDRVGAGDVLGAAARVLAILALAFPVLATLLLLAVVVRRLATQTWRRTEGRPAARALAGLLAAGLVAGLAWAWWPSPGAYRPIEAYERGSLRDAVPALVRSTPTGLAEGRAGRATTLWPAEREVPTSDRPALSVVLVPRDGGPDGSAPTWVFPFDRPLPPEAGDNQALAVNTTDGGILYDVALALVWADGDTVANTNEAYAFASCTGCVTVAVAFQVVLVSGSANVVVPQNLSGAVNYACVECVTVALAQQLVVTVPEELDDAARARLTALWAEIAAFGASIEGLSLPEIRARLAEYETRILEAVGVTPGAAATPSPAPSPSPSASASATPGTATPEPTPGASGAPTPSGSTEPVPMEPSPTTTSDPEPSPEPTASSPPEPSVTAEPSPSP